ncbi:MAG: hypothetical protein ACK52S_22025, partial [Pirellula sp.]
SIVAPKPSPSAIVRETAAIETKPFPGGELVFKHDRITLCGQTIFYYSRSKQTTLILEALNVKSQTGTWIAKSGPELVNELGIVSGQNSITCSIRAFRDSVVDLLESELGIVCGRQDVISSGGRGYRFAEWITIRDTRKADSDPTEIEDTPASRRQRIMELLGDGGKLRSTCIATHLGCSLKTVKRELETLRLAGKIEFIGPNKTGTYQLVAG